MSAALTNDKDIKLATAMQQLSFDGFVMLEHLCSADLVAAVLELSQRRTRELQDALGQRDIGIGSAAGYVEIVQRSPGRWDVPIEPRDLGVDEKSMPWWPLVTAILGNDAEHSFSGVVSSEPGSPAQCWHTDSPHVQADHLPPHALNVLVPLHDIPLNMGPTEFACGSHILSNHLSNKNLVIDELIYQDEGTTPETLAEGRDVATPTCVANALLAGACIVFDDRLLHRGLANGTAHTRYVAYFSYRRSGYDENTHFESQRSVFDIKNN